MVNKTTKRCGECGTEFIHFTENDTPVRVPKRLMFVKQPETIEDWNRMVYESAEWIANTPEALAHKHHKEIEEAERKARREAFMEVGRWAKQQAEDGQVSLKKIKKTLREFLGMGGDPGLEEVMQ